MAFVRPPNLAWTDGSARRIVGIVGEQRDCELCSTPIQPGEAWMANSASGGVAHSGCVYRDDRSPDDQSPWEPQERAAS
jgi:hypothetical protein